MVKIFVETTSNFAPWGGAQDTYKKICEYNKLGELDDLLDDLYPDGLSEGTLNDLLWFDDDFILENLGIKEDEEDELTCDSCGESVEEQDLWAHEDGNSYCCNCYPNI